MTVLEQEYNYTPLAKPLRITEQHWPEGTMPLVSIICITYNHVNFIRDAIEGFLMQETTFPVEIHIHDDASTDGTAEIVRDYEAIYPNLIKAICQTENQYSKGNKSGQFLRPLLRGKYIASCEGDDYWTDKAKLQLQVDYLELHPGCVISGHDAIVIDATGKVLRRSVVRTKGRDYTADELKQGEAILPTASRLVRNIHRSSTFRYRSCFQGGDRFTLVTLGDHGGAHFHDDISPSVYRKHQGGVWSGMDRLNQHLTGANTSYFLYLYFRERGDLQTAEHWQKKWGDQAAKSIPITILLKEVVSRILFTGYYRDWIVLVIGRVQIERIHQMRKKVLEFFQRAPLKGKAD